MKNRKGFTLIELLVVIAIIGLLSTLAVVALNSARQKARDAKRVADVKQVQTALELYYNDHNGYPLTPDNDTSVILGRANSGTNDCAGAACNCLNDDGIGAGSCSDAQPVYMGLIPSAPRPPADNDYIYAAYEDEVGGTACNTSGQSCSTYQISFTIENAITALGTGTTCTATPQGMSCS